MIMREIQIVRSTVAIDAPVLATVLGHVPGGYVRRIGEMAAMQIAIAATPTATLTSTVRIILPIL
jgi:hypothetical protein